MKFVVVPWAHLGAFKYCSASNKSDHHTMQSPDKVQPQTGNLNILVRWNWQWIIKYQETYTWVLFHNKSRTCDLIIVEVQEGTIHNDLKDKRLGGWNHFIASTPHEIPLDIQCSEEEYWRIFLEQTSSLSANGGREQSDTIITEHQTGLMPMVVGIPSARGVKRGSHRKESKCGGGDK